MLTTLWEQPHVGERNYNPLSTSWLTDFYQVFQFTSTISEIELPFLYITLRISDARIQTSQKHWHSQLPQFLFIPSSSLQRFFPLQPDSPPALPLLLWSTRSRDMVSSFTDRCYSLENDIHMVAAINRPNALRPSKQVDATVDSLKCWSTPLIILLTNSLAPARVNVLDATTVMASKPSQE